jgi:hypothetical protein
MRARILAVAALSTVIGGCSTHPLQDRVTGLSLYAVVDKIRCEAQEAVLAIFAEKGLDELKPGLIAADDRIKVLKKKLEPLEPIERSLKLARVEGLKQQARVNLEIAALINYTKRAEAEGVTEVPDYIYKKAKSVELAKLEWDARAIRYTKRLNDYRAAKVRIMQAIYTVEAHKIAKYKKLVDFYGNEMASFKDLADLDCSNAPANSERIFVQRYPIRGKIGVHEVIEQYIRLLAAGTFKKGGGEAYTDQIVFTTTLDGSVSPSFTINPTTAEQITGSFGLAGSRKDLHSVIISLAPAEPATADKITLVRLVDDDEDALLPTATFAAD